MTQADNSALVSAAWLAENLENPNLHVIEVSSASDDASYREAHVPGAHWWFWKGALWHETDRAFAAPEALAERLGGMGVGPDDEIVLYGDPVQFGTYAFWVLKMAGFQNLKLLDGSKKRWMADGMPVASETPAAAPVAHPAPEWGRDLERGQGRHPRQARRAGPGAARRAIPGGIQGRAGDAAARLRPRGRARRAHTRGRAPVLPGTAERGRHLQGEGRTRADSRCCCRSAR